MYKLSQNNQSIQLGKEIGRGGEAVIYEVVQRPDVVAKIYHAGKVPPLAKLQRMVDCPPHDPSSSLPHISIAWTQALILNQQGHLAGYLMAKVSNAMPLHLLSTPVSRKKHLPTFNWKYLHRTAHNLVAAVQAVHQAGYIIGDVNESNILVQPTALITLVDTDSFQVPNLQGSTFLCPVGKAEYTAPEIQGQAFDKVVRTELHDRFALAVLMFMLLQEGSHPFRGDTAELDKRIKQGLFFYHHQPLALMKTLFEGLHPELQGLFTRCFVEGHHQPSQRPSAKDWVIGLSSAEMDLIQCRANPEHWYYRGKPVCTWCERTKELQGNDPFPPSPDSLFIPAQKPLPPVTSVGRSSISTPATVQAPTSPRVLLISDAVKPKPQDFWQTAQGFLQKLSIIPSEQDFGQVLSRTQFIAINMEMVLIPAGEFEMGSKEYDESQSLRDTEKPIHRVKIEKAFYMGKFPVTQRQWRAVMGNNPSSQKGDNLPVEQVSWDDCVEFCERLSSQTNKVFRLPSEAEWEYACRAGTQSRYWWGDNMDNNRCWYNKSIGTTHAVDEKVSEHTNAFGLCDMLGNVWEWTHSDFTIDGYDGSEVVLSKNTNKHKTLRGGSWYNNAYCARSANRGNDSPTNKFNDLGFRVVLISP